jgi:hypothetical protein
MCFDRNINGNRDVKFLIGIIGHCTDERNLLYSKRWFIKCIDAFRSMYAPSHKK